MAYMKNGAGGVVKKGAGLEKKYPGVRKKLGGVVKNKRAY
jgi:hypothetical protein